MIADIVQPLLIWYENGHRDLPWRRTNNPYHIWLSEVMLQQTRVEAVIPYYQRFLKTCPDIQALAQAKEEVYLKLWEGLGYYSRVRNLHKAAQTVCEQYQGQLPGDYQALRKLPGIGEYTAGAIASIAFGIPVPAVDGNVLRVMARILGETRSIDTPAVRKELRIALEKEMPQDKPGVFNQALMELGAVVCIPNGMPRCQDCPVQSFCTAFHTKTIDQIPIRTPKKARQIIPRTVLVIQCHNKVAIQKRPAKGLLAGMWEFPAEQGHWNGQELRCYLQNHKYNVKKIVPLSAAKHIFTHVEWHMIGYWIEVEEVFSPFTWVSKDQLKGQYALPSALRAFLSVVEENF